MPLTPVSNQCTPECKSSKSEICAEIGNETKCICRPGFSRMFPDRPCKRKFIDVIIENISNNVCLY